MSELFSNLCIGLGVLFYIAVLFIGTDRIGRKN